MNDPYQVLGVSPDASQEEISRAYKKLAKKYHPDLHPGDKAAEEKMRQINEAYNAIRSGNTSPYQSGYGSGTNRGYSGYGNYSGNGSYGSYGPFGEGGFGDFWNFGRQYSNYSENSQQYNGEFYSSGNTQYSQVRNAIKGKRNREALDILETLSYRDAEWYYLSAIANYNLGNKTIAISHASKATNMDPRNMYYRDLYEKFTANANYTSRSDSYSGNTARMCMNFASCLSCLFCGRFFPCFWCF